MNDNSPNHQSPNQNLIVEDDDMQINYSASKNTVTQPPQSQEETQHIVQAQTNLSLTKTQASVQNTAAHTFGVEGGSFNAFKLQNQSQQPGEAVDNLIQEEADEPNVIRNEESLDVEYVIEQTNESQQQQQQIDGDNLASDEELKEVPKKQQSKSTQQRQQQQNLKKRHATQISNEQNELIDESDDDIDEEQVVNDRELGRVLRVDLSKLTPYIKSKRNIYNILANEGQLYLPPFEECTMEFMKEVFSGKKQCFANEDIKVIRVPVFEEFSAKAILEQIRYVPKFQLYLPDLTNLKRPLNREYLFNVINSVDSNFFTQNIRHAYKIRKLKQVENQQRNVEMSSYIYDLIKSSNQITSGQKGRAMNMLGVGAKKRSRVQRKPKQKFTTLMQFDRNGNTIRMNPNQNFANATAAGHLHQQPANRNPFLMKPGNAMSDNNTDKMVNSYLKSMDSDQPYGSKRFKSNYYGSQGSQEKFISLNMGSSSSINGNSSETTTKSKVSVPPRFLNVKPFSSEGHANDSRVQSEAAQSSNQPQQQDNRVRRLL